MNSVRTLGLGAAAIAGFVVSTSLQAQDHWKSSINKYDLRETYIDRKSIVLGVPCTARLKFICTLDSKGATGYLSLEYTITPSSKLSGFDLGFFEGPDATVGRKKLMRITLTQAGKRTDFQVGLSGWGSAEIEDGFVFGSGTPTRNKSGYMRKVVDAILAGAEGIELAVVDGKDPSRVILTSFPLTDSRQAFQSLMKGVK